MVNIILMGILDNLVITEVLWGISSIDKTIVSSYTFLIDASGVKCDDNLSVKNTNIINDTEVIINI